MKKINQYIIEKLKVTKNTDLHICKVELDHFIPWIYDMPYYKIMDLVPDDLTFPGVPFKDIMQKYFNNDPEAVFKSTPTVLTALVTTNVNSSSNFF